MSSAEGLKMTHSNQIDPVRKVCSLVTIQSDQRGHFAAIIDQLKAKTNYENALLQVSAIGDNLELVKFVAGLEDLVFSPRPLYKQKDEAESSRHRALGNEWFQKRDYQQACFHYTISVIRAEYPSNNEKASSSTLAFALGNRSACLLNLGHYKEAVADINLALAVGYPEDSRYKLYERLGRVYLKMGLGPRAKTSLIISQQLLAKSTLDESKKADFAATLAKLTKECDQNKSKLIQPATESKTECDDDLGSSNPDYPALSSKTTVESRPNYGRHVVSTADVGVAETVLVEEAHAAVLFPEKVGTYCSHCFKRFKAAIPCTRCSGIVFCSLICRDAALETYHKYECEYQDVLNGLGCSQVVRLALRMITQKPYQFFVDRKPDLLEIGDDTRSVDPDLDPFVKSAALVGLNDQRWPEDRFLRAVMAVVLVGILRSAGYFGEKKDMTSGLSITPNEMFVGSMLLRCMQVLQFNAHEVYEVLRIKENSARPTKNVAIGLAVYPTASYFNHSCHGDVVRYFKGSKLYIKSLHPIEAGSEVCENYGPTFYVKPRTERQAELSGRYWFQCTCQPCLQNWQLLEKLATDATGEQLKEVDELMAEGRLEECIERLSGILKSFRKNTRPSQTQVRAEDKLRTCIYNLGSFSVVEKKTSK